MVEIYAVTIVQRNTWFTTGLQPQKPATLSVNVDKVKKLSLTNGELLVLFTGWSRTEQNGSYDDFASFMHSQGIVSDKPLRLIGDRGVLRFELSNITLNSLISISILSPELFTEMSYKLVPDDLFILTLGVDKHLQHPQIVKTFKTYKSAQSFLDFIRNIFNNQKYQWGIETLELEE